MHLQLCIMAAPSAHSGSAALALIMSLDNSVVCDIYSCLQTPSHDTWWLRQHSFGPVMHRVPIGSMQKHLRQHSVLRVCGVKQSGDRVFSCHLKSCSLKKMWCSPCSTRSCCNLVVRSCHLGVLSDQVSRTMHGSLRCSMFQVLVTVWPSNSGPVFYSQSACTSLATMHLSASAVCIVGWFSWRILSEKGVFVQVYFLGEELCPYLPNGLPRDLVMGADFDPVHCTTCFLNSGKEVFPKVWICKRALGALPSPVLPTFCCALRAQDYTAGICA